MTTFILKPGDEIEYSSLVVLKHIQFSKNNKRYPLRIKPNIREPIQRILVLTGETGINYGSYSYSNFRSAEYLDVAYTKTSWEYTTISFINSSFQRMLKTSKLIPRNYKFISNIKALDKITFKLSIGFKTFNSVNSPNDNNQIQRGITYRLAIQPCSIWVSSITKQFGIEWLLLQMRECGIDNSKCLFPISVNPPPPPPPPPPPMLSSNTYRNHPNFQKFFKMLSVGIPIQAVKNKMELLGFDSNILDKPDSIVPSSINNNSNNSRGALLAEIKNGKNLRKVSKSDINTKNNNDSRITINLNDILDARNNLKKKENKDRPYWK